MYQQEEQVYFIRGRYFHFGHRNNKAPLTSHLDIDDVVIFDAVRCDPSNENKHCSWIAKVVFKGKRPDTSFASLDYILKADTRRSSEVTGRDTSASASVSSHNDALCREFESDGPVREGPGQVVKLMAEETGLAMWMVAPNTWESVFFHKGIAYLEEMCLADYTLKDAFTEGEIFLQLLIQGLSTS